MAKKQKNFKRCPRCDTKSPINQPKCESCGLIYSRLSFATNAEAKRALKKHKKHLVVYDKTLPKDVNKWKLFFIAFFLGFIGTHNFRVGKYKMATFNLIATILLLIAAALPFEWWNDYILASVITGMSIPAGFNLIFWAWDWVCILCNTYKVPVAIEEANLIAAKELENKDVIKIVKDLDKQAKEQVQEQTKEQEETKLLEDELNPVIQKENINKGNLGKKTKPKKQQKSKQEQVVEKEEPFVPKSKVISSEEVKRLINKNARKSSNNQNKKKK